MKGLTKNRCGVYKMRIRVPQIAKPYFQREEINISLDTKHLKVAQSKAFVFNQSLERVVNLLKMDIMNGKQYQEVVDHFISSHLNQRKDTSPQTDKSSTVFNQLPSPSISFGEAYLSYKRFYNTKQIHDATKMDTFRVLDKLQIIIGAKTNISQLSTETILHLQETLSRLPNMNLPQYKHLPFTKILLLKNVPSKDIISDNRLHGYFKHIKKFFSFCYDEGWMRHNLTNRLIINVSANKKEAFNDYEMSHLLEHINTLDEHLRLLYLCYIYTGMRREELYNSVIINVSHLPCFHIQQGKNSSSIRTIPLHNVLIDLDVDNNRLKLAKSVIGHQALAKKFNESIKPKITTDKKKTLHSLRHTFATKLQNTNVSDDIIKQLLGHTPRDTLNKVYTSGKENMMNTKKLQRLKASIDKLSFEATDI